MALFTKASAPVPVAPAAPVDPLAPYLAEPLPTSVGLLTAESRKHNVEFKKILEDVQSKIGELQKTVSESAKEKTMALDRAGLTPSMESTVLMFNIQRIIQENERLKKDVRSLGSEVFIL